MAWEHLIDQIEKFHKNAGILEAPAHLVKTLTDWCAAKYCYHMLFNIETIIQGAKLRKDHLQIIREQCKNLFNIEQLASDIDNDFDTFLAYAQKDNKVSYFETVDGSEFGSQVLFSKIPIFSLHVDVNEFGKYNLFYYIRNVGDLKELNEVKLTKVNLTKEKLIELIKANNSNLSSALNELDSFVKNYEIPTDKHIENLKFLRGFCEKNIATGQSLNPSNEELWLTVSTKDLPYVDKLKKTLDHVTISCDFVTSQEASTIYSKESWSGLWSPSGIKPSAENSHIGTIYVAADINKDFKKMQYSNYQVWKQRLDFIRMTVRHELQHFMQSFIKYMQQMAEIGGLPSKKIRSPEVDPHGIKDTKTNVTQINHELRDVEFYTRLADSIEDFEKATSAFLPAWLRELYFKYWTDQIEEPQFKTEANIIYNKNNPSQNNKSYWNEADRFKYNLMDASDFKKKNLGGEFFVSLKANQPEKYQKAVKEFYKKVM